MDEFIKSQIPSFGDPDAVSVTLGGGVVAGGGISGSIQVAAFISGVDAGGVFAASSTAKTFNRFTLAGHSIELAGGFKTLSGTVSMGIASIYYPIPTSYTISTSVYGASAFKKGASMSVSNMKLQSVLVHPPKK